MKAQLIKKTEQEIAERRVAGTSGRRGRTLFCQHNLGQAASVEKEHLITRNKERIRLIVHDTHRFIFEEIWGK